MYILRVKSHFDAAHRLEDYDGKCSRLHGHRWDVEIRVVGETLDDINMLVDFGYLKQKLKAILDGVCDHYGLNESLQESNPTAEFIAQWLYTELIRTSNDLPGLIQSVRIWESPDCSVEYTGA